MGKASRVVDTLHACWRVYKYMIGAHGSLWMPQLPNIRHLHPAVSHATTALQLMQYNSDLCVRAHRDEYNFVSRTFLDELLTKPQTQGGPRFLYLHVSVSVVRTRQSVCIHTWQWNTYTYTYMHAHIQTSCRNIKSSVVMMMYAHVYAHILF